jgi:hypothetical protein
MHTCCLLRAAAHHLQVSNATVTVPGKPAVDVATYVAPPSPPAGTAGSTSSSAAPAPPAVITVVDIKSSDLEVVVAAPAPPPPGAAGIAVAAPPPPPPINLAAIIDTTPPVITMTGDVFVSVLQADTFTDPGVRVHDNIDGNSLAAVTRLQLCTRPSFRLQTLAPNDTRVPAGCGQQLAGLNTTAPLRDNETYVLTYTARDTAKNSATPLRRYVVVASRCACWLVCACQRCTAAASSFRVLIHVCRCLCGCWLCHAACRCAAPERWCPDLSACSVQGLCMRALTGGGPGSSSAASGAAAAPPLPPVFVAPVDKAPPKLVLLGNGSAAVTATGAAVLMVNVTWKSAWTDPGATATDAVDGDLSDSIQSFGAGAVDTRIPTPPNRSFGFLVEYYVEDRSKNAAPVARRLIRVVCPGAEAYCIDPDTSKPTCTTNGVCGAPALLAMAPSSGPSATGSTSASAATSTARSSSSSSVAAAPAAPPRPPNISLLVPGPVQITAGGVYDRCADSAPITDVCERGIAADDARDGNMERQALVCGQRWVACGQLACTMHSRAPELTRMSCIPHLVAPQVACGQQQSARGAGAAGVQHLARKAWRVQHHLLSHQQCRAERQRGAQARH